MSTSPPTLSQQVSEYKKKQKCKTCKGTNNLTLHHRDPAEKIASVGDLIAHGCSPETVWAEVAKCDVLCEKCHRDYHEKHPYENKISKAIVNLQHRTLALNRLNQALTEAEENLIATQILELVAYDGMVHIVEWNLKYWTTQVMHLRAQKKSIEENNVILIHRWANRI